MCIDRVYIKVIDRRIRDRIDKMTINRPLQYYAKVKHLHIDPQDPAHLTGIP